MFPGPESKSRLLEPAPSRRERRRSEKDHGDAIPPRLGFEVSRGGIKEENYPFGSIETLTSGPGSGSIGSGEPICKGSREVTGPSRSVDTAWAIQLGALSAGRTTAVEAAAGSAGMEKVRRIAINMRRISQERIEISISGAALPTGSVGTVRPKPLIDLTRSLA